MKAGLTTDSSFLRRFQRTLSILPIVQFLLEFLIDARLMKLNLTFPAPVISYSLRKSLIQAPGQHRMGFVREITSDDQRLRQIFDQGNGRIADGIIIAGRQVGPRGRDRCQP